MKIALIHEWLTNVAGSEKVLMNFMELFPGSPVYTLIYNPEAMPDVFKDKQVYTSFINNLWGAKKKHQRFLPLMPIAFEQFDLSRYDIVLSSSSACAKGVITRADTMHVCYCHTPIRYAWDFYHLYLQNEKSSWIKKLLIPVLMNYLRLWDVGTANRVDYFIANSYNVANRIRKHYRRDAEVIHPPIDTHFFTPDGKKGDYYLIVSRLVPYKKVDIAVKAFNKLGLKLVVIGNGSELQKLKNISGTNIEFPGWQPDEVIRDYYRGCKAVIFPGEEDFGMTPLEAQACGKPVIAYGKGGALETVIEGKTGLFFMQQDETSLIEAVRRYESLSFDEGIIRKHAESFGKEEFKGKLNLFIDRKYNEFKKMDGKRGCFSV